MKQGNLISVHLFRLDHFSNTREYFSISLLVVFPFKFYLIGSFSVIFSGSHTLFLFLGSIRS